MRLNKILSAIWVYRYKKPLPPIEGVNRIKRIATEVMALHKSKFGTDFAQNKKALDEIAIVRSKGLKNEISGYITTYIKREIEEQKEKEAQAMQETSSTNETEELQAEEILN
jgi:small subunit ribosomal protein S17e